MGHLLSRVWIIRAAEPSDASSSDDNSLASLNFGASYTQADGRGPSGDRNSIVTLPDDLMLKYVFKGGGGGKCKEVC